MFDRMDFRRFTFVTGIAALVVVLIVWRYFSLMIIPRPTHSRGTETGMVERGPILDRNGKILAIETKQHSVSAWMPSVVSRRADARLLAPILGIPRQRLLASFATHTGFLYLARKIPDPETEAIKKLIASGSLTGISLKPSFARIYPNGNLAGHVIGYVGTDNQGLAGVEYSYNNLLSPSPPPHSAGTLTLGDRVYLTIDENLQYEAAKLAGAVYHKSHAKVVMALVEQAKTGQILADVSYPEFDPNLYARYPASAREDYPISYIYEPGSVMKIFTISSFLQLGGITPAWKVYDNGYYVRHLRDGRTIRIHGLAPHEWENAQLIIKWSSNVGAAYASNTVSRPAFYSMLRAFGFGRPTYVGLPGEQRGILRPVIEWSARSKPDIAFGQEIGVTAMQIVEAASALANRGVLLKPRIISKIVAPDGKIAESFPREPLRRVLSPKVASEMLADMHTGTEPGAWAYGARLAGIPVSAKTGTSQVYNPQTGTYSNTDFIASSISVFPTVDPRYIVYAAVVDPKGPRYWGFQIATPLVRKISAFLAGYTHLRKNTDRIVAAPRMAVLPRPAPIRIGTRLPDVLQRSLRAILPLLVDPKLKVVLRGHGWVVSQSPAPGTPIRKGMVVTLHLRPIG